MLESFFVSNFRLFKRLELEKLGRVNLIVGKNGSGKSALLEAIRLYASNGNLHVLLDSIQARQEIFGQDSFFKHLFEGRKLPDFDGEGIRLGITSKSDECIHITLAAYAINRHSEGIVRNRVRKQEIPVDQADINPFLVVEYESNQDRQDTTRRIVDLKEGHNLTEFRRYHASLNVNSPNKTSYSVQIVPAQNIDVNHLALLWDKMALTDLEDEVILGLQLMMPKIKNLTFVEEKTDTISKVRIPLVRLEGKREPSALKSMGDGVFRLFHIIIALVNSQDGILLIDELENGLHWQIHSKVWDVIFRLAEKLNVQVFATTHSSDCIRGFEAVWREQLELGTFFRLDVKEQKVKATYYDHEILHDAIIADVEVR